MQVWHNEDIQSDGLQGSFFNGDLFKGKLYEVHLGTNSAPRWYTSKEEAEADFALSKAVRVSEVEYFGEGSSVETILAGEWD